MIKRLRQKFIVVTMCSLIAVISVIIAVINIANFNNINKNAENLLSILSENRGIFPKPEDMPFLLKPPHRKVSPELPFVTRYFTVVVDKEGAVVSCDIGKIAAVTEEKAAGYAVLLHEKGKKHGFIYVYKYRCIQFGDDEMYIFLDCSRELSTFKSFLWASVLTSLAGVMLVFALIVFFSKMAVKPVVESYEKQKQFITDASHEIKTPLAIIGANAEVIEMEMGESQWTKSIKNQILRLSGMTEKLILLSRMEEEAPKLHLETISLSKTAADVAESFNAIAASERKIFEFEIDENLFCVCDRGMMCHMLSLLLDNAMKYSSENGEIFFGIKRAKKHIEIVIKNTVDEIEKGKLDMLFERFYRRDPSRNSQKGGYGIGLAAARAIAVAHKGKISACSEDGRSVKIDVTLPLADKKMND
ncbi:MAG: HAMP domain-containing histidine kinase [Firmicutes bacterium]|nr:HAMP domain-containing histidine kinase [Bacillota bacterium]